MIWVYVCAGAAIAFIYLEANPRSRGVGLRVRSWWHRQGWDQERKEDPPIDQSGSD